LSLAARIKDGIRDAGGVPFEFPIHPIQESAAGRPPRSTGTWPIWAGGDSGGYPSTAWC